MKKLVASVCVLALVVVAGRTYGQEKKSYYHHPMPKMGVKGGVSFTGISNLNGKERVTGHGGIFVNHAITKNWAIQTELLYAAQGQHFTNDVEQSRVLALDYIQAPFMLQYYPAKRFYLEAGPQVGILVNSKTKDAESGGNKSNVTDNYRKADIGINAGLGVAITKHIGIYGRYTQGLVDVTKPTTTYRVNSGVQLGAAIKF